MITLLRAADRKAVSWKNGGGVTREIAVFPVGADMTDFAWRLSLAEVEFEGAFSVFPEVDRVLAVIEGELELTFDDHTSPMIRDRKAGPLAFPGDAPAYGKPIGGDVRDLNLMVRREQFMGTLTPFRHAGPIGPTLKEGVTVLVVALSPVVFNLGEDTIALETLDAILIQPWSNTSLPLRCVSGAGYVATMTDLSGS